MRYSVFAICLLIFIGSSCQEPSAPTIQVLPQSEVEEVVVGAERMDVLLPLLEDKKVGIITNHTGLIKGKHLVDSLLSRSVDVVRIFAPEHGFRGDAANGEKIEDDRDPVTGLEVISLYGKNKKPSAEQLAGLDVLLFDIQDVGARFYTYISTMQLAMESASENDVKFIVLDRPNPNGHYVDGPVLDMEYQSFVGIVPVPVVHGCTVGELASMINGEQWMENGVSCELEVVPCLNYDHKTFYELPVAPSPNLPNMSSVYLYPSLCFFEATNVSVGRGTDLPFQRIGIPGGKIGADKFTPVNIPGVAKDPKHEGIECTGLNLSEYGDFFAKSEPRLHLKWFFMMHEQMGDDFLKYPKFLNKLSGTDAFAKALKEGWNEEQLRESWQKELKEYKECRKKYLLYPDFE